MDQYGIAYNGHLGEHLQVVALGDCGLCLEVSCLCLAETGDGVELYSIRHAVCRAGLHLRYRV